MGKILIIVGLIAFLAGLIIHFSGKIPWLGKLPGDFRFQRGDVTFYFPLTTCVLISILISVVLYFLNRGKN